MTNEQHDQSDRQVLTNQQHDQSYRQVLLSLSVPVCSAVYRYDVRMRCLVARVNYKTLIVICAVFTLITVLLWNRCSSELPPGPPHQLRAAFTPEAEADADAVGADSPEAPPVARKVPYEEIECLINEDTTIKGKREGGEVFLPFSWVEKYFGVYGRIAQYDGSERFEFSHSYSKVYAQREPYHPDGVFMSFEGYNVEVRERVKCISGVEGELRREANTTV